MEMANMIPPVYLEVVGIKVKWIFKTYQRSFIFLYFQSWASIGRFELVCFGMPRKKIQKLWKFVKMGGKRKKKVQKKRHCRLHISHTSSVIFILMKVQTLTPSECSDSQCWVKTSFKYGRRLELGLGIEFNGWKNCICFGVRFQR